MNKKIRELLNQENIGQAKVLVNEYNFFLDDISIQIGVKIYKNITELDGFSFTQSHYLKTPKQIGAYMTNSRHSDSEEGCLDKAIKTFTSFYNDAVRTGCKPSNEWLVVNENY